MWLLAVGQLVGLFALVVYPINSIMTRLPFLMLELMLWATALGWLIFGDVPGLMTWVGAAVILASGLYVYRHSGHESEAHLQ